MISPLGAASKQGLGADSWVISLYFIVVSVFVLVALRQFWYKGKHQFVWSLTAELKKKKNSLPCFSSHQITIQIHKKSVPPPAAITSSVPITPATSNFVVQRHHNDDPAFRWPSAHLLQSTPDHLRRPASPNPDPCQCCTAKSLHLVHHCRTKLWCRSNQSSPLFSREPHLSLHNLYCVLKFCCLCLLVTSGQGRHVSSLTKPAHQP